MMEERQDKPTNSQEQIPDKSVVGPGSELSPGLRKILEREGVHAEIDAAMDAAMEEGFVISRNEAKDILRKNDLEKSSQQ